MPLFKIIGVIFLVRCIDTESDYNNLLLFEFQTVFFV